jgi:hypothetical protein
LGPVAPRLIKRPRLSSAHQSLASARPQYRSDRPFGHISAAVTANFSFRASSARIVRGRERTAFYPPISGQPCARIGDRLVGGLAAALSARSPRRPSHRGRSSGWPGMPTSIEELGRFSPPEARWWSKLCRPARCAEHPHAGDLFVFRGRRGDQLKRSRARRGRKWGPARAEAPPGRVATGGPGRGRACPRDRLPREGGVPRRPHLSGDPLDAGS